MGALVPIMSTKVLQKENQQEQPRSSDFGSALFTETQQRLLGLLFGQPRRSFYTKELIKLAASGSGAVQRELKRREASGLTVAHWQGNQKHYQANPAAPIYAELCGIAEKTFGLAEPLRESLVSLTEQISIAFIFGSVAKRSENAYSDIDLMVVSDVLTYGQLMPLLEIAEQRLGRRINPTIYTSSDFQQRRQQNNSFLTRVMQQDKIWLIGND